MSFADIELARLLVALAVLLMAAHGMGSLFSRFGQSPAIGEIVGGIMLGPTALAAICPGIQQWIFPRAGMSAAALGAVYQLGLLLLMFAAGAEMRRLLSVTRTHGGADRIVRPGAAFRGRPGTGRGLGRRGVHRGAAMIIPARNGRSSPRPE